jgi:hypothetical protein
MQPMIRNKKKAQALPRTPSHQSEDGGLSKSITRR